jgi:hypothetical protein
MNLTCFYSNSEIIGNKNKLQNFLHPVSFDPGSLTGGARGPPTGDAGAEARTARWPRGQRSGAGKRRLRGPGGPEPHPELAGEVDGAGGELVAAESMAVLRRLRGESAMAAAILGTPSRFLHRGCCRRRGGAARLVGGAGGGVEWRG